MTGTGDAFETLAVHAGGEPDPSTGAIVPPISLASTFAQREPAKPFGEFEYSRSGNPTRTALERCVAALEGATYGLAFASGLAAEDAVLRHIPPQRGILLADDVYGGTYRLVSKVFGGAGVRWSTADLTDPARVASNWRPDTGVVWIETPSNPLMKIVDIEAIVAIAHERDAIVVVDNTFATPYLQQPLALGADVVVHSSTKYLGGHSDVVGGFVATNDPAVAEEVRFLQNAAGAVPSPFDCYLVLRGCRTLALRMERHCANAAAVVALLVSHPAVAQVYWPGLGGHAGHDIAKRQMRDFGGMVSFTMAGGPQAAAELVRNTRLFTLAESLGAVESLIELPAPMTHASVAGSPLAVDPALVRISVGIEAAADLVADLRDALDAV